MSETINRGRDPSDGSGCCWHNDRGWVGRGRCKIIDRDGRGVTVAVFFDCNAQLGCRRAAGVGGGDGVVGAGRNCRRRAANDAGGGVQSQTGW